MTTYFKVALVLSLLCAGGDAVLGDDKPRDGDAHAHPHSDEVTLTAEAIRTGRIRVEPVTKHTLSATFTAPARVAFDAEAMAHVGSLAAGRVVEIAVRVGEAVKKGDPLLIVESTELGQAQSEYLQKRTELAVAAAAVEPATQAFDRAKKLHDQSQAVALGEVQKRQAEMRAAEGNALVAKAATTAALNRLLLLGMTPDEAKEFEESGALKPRLTVRAPITGRVIEREATLGELVSPEKDRLLVIADTGAVWVLCDVPESRLAQVSVGSPASVQLAAVPGRRFDGKVTHVAPALDPDTRAVRVRVDVANADGLLRPGMFASVALTDSATGEAVVAVPDEAIQTVEGGPSVFVPVEGEANTFAKRAVKPGGRAVGGLIPIVSGLKEGESVVVSGSFLLKAELGKGEASHEH